MANKPITMLQIRRIIQLKSQGKSNREIARDLHSARETVNAYVNQIVKLDKSFADLLQLDNEHLSSLVIKETGTVPEDQRYGDLFERLPGLLDELKKPHVTRMILWEEYRRQQPQGYGYTQFCEHLSRLLKTQNAVMHFEHEPAASMMFDFAGDTIRVVDSKSGEISHCKVLVCTLPFSGYTYIEAMYSANRPSLLKALNNAFDYFGGVPLSVKTDNMKQVVIKSNRYEPSFDELFEQWALHYGTTLMAARVGKPRDKASVESHVRAVYNRIYSALRNMVFHSVDQVNDALMTGLKAFNDRHLQHCDYSRRERFMLHEHALLLSLPGEWFIPKNKVQAKVQRNCHITLGEDWHHYSVPFMHIGKTVQVIYDTAHVEIYLDTVRIACHERTYLKNGYTTMEEHLPPHHRHFGRIKGYTPDYFTEKALLVGPSTTDVVDRILSQKIFPQQTYNSCIGLLRLGAKYGTQRLEAACVRALMGYKVTYMAVRHILERNLDQQKDQPDLALSIPEHENIRGAGQYQ